MKKVKLTSFKERCCELVYRSFQACNRVKCEAITFVPIPENDSMEIFHSYDNPVLNYSEIIPWLEIPTILDMYFFISKRMPLSIGATGMPFTLNYRTPKSDRMFDLYSIASDPELTFVYDCPIAKINATPEGFMNIIVNGPDPAIYAQFVKYTEYIYNVI